jgi:hypothetical protein
MFHALVLCIENTFDIQIYWKMRNLCYICSFIGLYFICQHIYLCVKHVFNAWYLCVKCTNLWMNELCTTFIINLSHVKFVMCCCCLLHVIICCLLLLTINYYYSSPNVVCCCLSHVAIHCSLLPLACIACCFIIALFSYTNYPFPLCCCYSSLTFATCCDSSFILVLEL